MATLLIKFALISLFILALIGILFLMNQAKHDYIKHEEDDQ